MNILIGILLVAGGLGATFYLRPKMQGHLTEMQYLKTKSVAELLDAFVQMEAMNLGEEYREFVELKGRITDDTRTTTPFSNREVAYCESSVMQVTEIKEQYRSDDGSLRTRTIKKDVPISSEHSSQEIYLKDDSHEERVVLEINGVGCKLDIPKTLDRFEPKNNMGRYSYFNSFSAGRFGADTLGFKMVEKTIDNGKNLYVIGEAYREGGLIHIGKPQDRSKPFIVSTKTEEELVNKSNQNVKYALFGGIGAIVLGIIIIVMQIL